MTTQPRWLSEGGPERTRWYLERFRRLAAEGADLEGEARLVDAMVTPRSRILDAGSGTGRVAAALAARGHEVVGVDVDPKLVESATSDHPGPEFLLGDLSTLDLGAVGHGTPFDAAVMAGNVMTYLAPDSERDVLTRVGAHVRPDGIVVVGFGTDRGYCVAAFDGHAAGAGLVLEHRFATWDLRPWRADATFAVSIFRRT